MKIIGRTVLRIELQPKRKEANGKYSSRDWKKDRKIFDKMFSYSRLYNSAASNACRPILIHPLLMCIVFEHYKQLDRIQNEDL